MLTLLLLTLTGTWLASAALTYREAHRGIDALLDAGHARALDANMTPYAAIPLRETARVAELVRARLSP